MKEKDEEKQEEEYEIVFEPAAQLKADVIWKENKRRSDAQPGD